jgi:hypothetical protein
VLSQVGASLFHLNENVGLPDTIGEGRTSTVLFRLTDAEFRFATSFEQARVPERLEEPIEEQLGFAFLVTFDVLSVPIDEISEALCALV